MFPRKKQRLYVPLDDDAPVLSLLADLVFVLEEYVLAYFVFIREKSGEDADAG